MNIVHRINPKQSKDPQRLDGTTNRNRPKRSMRPNKTIADTDNPTQAPDALPAKRPS